MRRSFSFSIEKGLSAGGEINMSLISIAMSWVKDATTYSYFVRWEVIPRVANCDSIWANHTRGSAVQKGGSLSETAATRSFCCPSLGGALASGMFFFDQMVCARRFNTFHENT